jgi:ribosomal-protein-alanine N-acetyltransferase
MELHLNQRKATLNDLPFILQIENEQFGLDAFPEKDFIEAIDPQENIGEYVIQVLEVEGIIVGYIMASRFTKENFYIESIAISSDFHNRGCGKYMMSIIESHLKNKTNSITLQVSADNKSAKHLYEKLGYQYTGEITENFYSDGSSALSMIKYISD